MKKSIITTSFIALVVSLFSFSAQAEDSKKASLSITPAYGTQLKSMKSNRVKSQSTIHTSVTIGNQQKKQKSKLVYKQKKRVQQAKLTKKAKLLIKPLVVQYTVKKGDTLYEIAKQHGTTIEHIMRINKLKSTKIMVGQLLNV